MSEGSLVARLQQEVADRQPVDWNALMSELKVTNAASPDVIRDVALLRLLDEIGQAHSAFQSGDFESDQTSTIPLVEPSLDDTLDAWGRYLLDQKVGRGGFGNVYRAWDPMLEMPVAIKILHRKYDDERLKQRLIDEGRALAQVKHPNVVRVLNVELHDGRLGLVMEYLAGETMDAIVTARGKLNEREAMVIVEDVCRALTAVHAKGLIHRDVKARNIIRESAGRIVLMDFGAGLSMTAAQEKGTAVGTPLYMAPETLAGEAATVASDVYGVGVLLFYLVTGRHPVEGRTVDDIREAHAERRQLSVASLQPDLPPAFVKVVDRALAFEARDRYSTPAALLQAIRAARDGEAAPSRWKARVAIAALLLPLLVVMMTIGGLLSTAAFNKAMGSADFMNESFVDWFLRGFRSSLMPLVATLFGTLLVGLTLSVRNVVSAASGPFRRADEAFSERCRELARRLGLSEPSVCASWLVLLTICAAVSIWMYWANLLQAITSDINNAPRQALAVLSPPYWDYRAHYRLALALAAAANVAGWYLLARNAKLRGMRLPAWVPVMEFVVLVLLYGSMQITHRIANDSDEFRKVWWRSNKCFQIGENDHARLLFCPSLTPRNHIVEKTESVVIQKDGEDFFELFAPDTQLGS